MRKLIHLGIFLALTGAAGAQVTRTESLRPTTPADDSKPNSDKVPDAFAVAGQFERVLVLRLKHQADLLAGIQSMVKEHKIKNGVILTGAGSVRNYHLHSVHNRTFPSLNVFIKDPTGAADIISMNGYVLNGRVHAHMTLANDDKAFGGHLEPGTNVFTFAVVTIGVMGDSLDFSRLDDKTLR
jgi:predicted DNA-binding protein with PD1-like motif